MKFGGCTWGVPGKVFGIKKKFDVYRIALPSGGGSGYFKSAAETTFKFALSRGIIQVLH